MARPRKIPSGGEQLEATLITRGLSRLALCEKIGASPAAMSRWIAGKRKPSLRMALKLEAELGLSSSIWYPASAAAA